MTALDEAIRSAEEALAITALRYPNGWGGYDTLSECTEALRSLLAAAKAPASSTDPWTACGCPNPNDCEHVYYGEPAKAPAPALPEAVRCERCDRIDAYAGERCEASGSKADPCGPVEYHDVEGVPLCAECWQECVDEAAEGGPDAR